MPAAAGTFHNGRVTFASPPDWREGAAVHVELLSPAVSLREEDFPLKGERLAEWMTRVDALEPFLTSEEEVRWETAMKEEKTQAIANSSKEFGEIASLFQ